MASIEGHKTNHSLRATDATALYQAGVPENIIQERTGHLSLKGLRQYECTSDEQHQAISRVLAASHQITYEHQLSATNSYSTTTTTVTLPARLFHSSPLTVVKSPASTITILAKFNFIHAVLIANFLIRFLLLSFCLYCHWEVTGIS